MTGKKQPAQQGRHREAKVQMQDFHVTKIKPPRDVSTDM